MNAPHCLRAIAIFSFALFFGLQAFGLSQREEQRAQLALRLVGHKFLHSVGDSTSRVLPIEKKDEGYKVSFEREFAFVPDSLVDIINRVFLKHKIAKGYNVAVLDCQSQKVVYNFEINFIENGNMVPCGGRNQSLGCYELYFTLINEPILALNEFDTLPFDEGQRPNWALIIWLFIVVLAIALVFVFLNKKRKNNIEELNFTKIGSFRLNEITGELFYNNVREILSAKEMELLLLLWHNKNQTIERDEILRQVWNDDGVYVGRTLDVFISKLRKKLEADEQIKLINVRGVGYKLLLAD